MIRVAIIDDEFYYRTSLISNMPWAENGMEVVGDANDGLSGEQLLLASRPDIALVDINMPGQSGLELIASVQLAGFTACRYVILTGYDDFKFAQRAISLGVSDYVLKPVEYGQLLDTLIRLKAEIQQQLSERSKLSELEHDNQNHRRDKLFTELVNFRRSTSAEEQRELLGEVYGRFAVALIAPRQQATGEQLERIRQALQRVRMSFPFSAFLDGRGHLAVLMDVGSQGQPEHLLDMILNALDAHQPLDVGLGRGVHSFDQMCLSYSEALIALRNHTIHGGADAGRTQPNAQLIAERKNRLRGYLLNLERGKLEQSLEGIYAQLYNSKAPYDYILLNTLELFALLMNTLDRQSVSTEGLIVAEHSLMEEMERLTSVGEFQQWICERFRLGIERLSEKRRAHSDPTQSVLDYIHENLGNPGLSVALIAGSLFMNYSYICYAFKRDMGLTVNEYITQLRIQKAKDSFADGLVNIAYVARQVGYEDQGYFSKSFKKKEGLTPSEFIRSLGNG